MSLEFSHRKLLFRKFISKLASHFFMSWVESQEKSFHLIETSISKVSMEISSAGSHQSRVKLFFMICGHKQDSSLLGSNTIKSIEKSRKGHSTICSLVHTFTSNENTINVFKKDNRLTRGIVESSVKTIVIHICIAQVQVTNVKFQSTSNGLSE